MSAVTYTAVRELMSGHSASTEYDFDLRCRAIDPDTDEKKNKSLSLSGANSETIVLRRKKLRDITTAAVTGTERDNMREFLESVSEGEAFEFDEFGSATTPDDPQSVELEGSYSESRTIKLGDGGADDYFRYKFNIRFK